MFLLRTGLAWEPSPISGLALLEILPINVANVSRAGFIKFRNDTIQVLPFD